MVVVVVVVVAVVVVVVVVWRSGGAMSRVSQEIHLAADLKATSLSFPEIISLGDPTTRWHSIIWSSRGSLLAMEKNLAAGD